MRGEHNKEAQEVISWIENHLRDLNLLRVDKNSCDGKFSEYETKIEYLRCLYKANPFSDSQVRKIQELKKLAMKMQERILPPLPSDNEKRDAIIAVCDRTSSGTEKEAYGGVYSTTDGQ